ncbi:ABC transporter permease subunit [Streptosporangiaceae bacterium NEAU-GS5]|nr:ABC transporter permease subunit [Streptosporangiaceae bacterium NEAU-GS5]
MRAGLRAELTKLRTTPAPAWLLAAIVALTVGAGAAATAVGGSPGTDTPRLALTGVQLGQAAAVMFGISVISGEYATGLIRTTFTAMPRRASVLAAKAGLVAGLGLAAGALAVLGSLLAATLAPPGGGAPALSLADGATLRAAIGSALYLTLMAVFGLGVGAAVQDAATAAGVALGVPYLLTIVMTVVNDQDLGRLLYRISPMSAGLTVQMTTDLSASPIGPWAGLGVLAAWAAAALAGGGLLVLVRDA